MRSMNERFSNILPAIQGTKNRPEERRLNKPKLFWEKSDYH
jgi:hypothetical protein